MNFKLHQIGNVDPGIKDQLIEGWKSERIEVNLCILCGSKTINRGGFVEDRNVHDFPLCSSCMDRAIKERAVRVRIQQIFYSLLQASTAGLN